MKSVENVCNGTEGKRLCGDTVRARLSGLYAAAPPWKFGRKLSWLTNNLCLYNILSSLVILITWTASDESRNYIAHHFVILFILLLLCSLGLNIFLCTSFITSYIFSWMICILEFCNVGQTVGNVTLYLPVYTEASEWSKCKSKQLRKRWMEDETLWNDRCQVSFWEWGSRLNG